MSSKPRRRAPAWRAWISMSYGRYLLVAVLVVAGIEWIASARAYRSRVGPGDWNLARQAVKKIVQEDPSARVFVAERWLGDAARMQIDELDHPSWAAPPDLRGLDLIYVLGLDQTWSADLEADLEDLGPASKISHQALGNLSLHTYALDAPQEIFSLLEHARIKNGVEVKVAGRRCRRAPGEHVSWICKPHRIDLQLLEIDYRPRQCLALHTHDDAPVVVRIPDIELGDTVRGHLGFGDFNARLRSDAPVRLRLKIDGIEAGNWLFSDSQGWAPFAARVAAPGRHDIEIHLSAPVMGQWTKRGYRIRPSHIPCFEIRGFLEIDRKPGAP